MQKIAELALGVFPYFHCACFHHGAVRGALEHPRLDSCFLKCVDKLKGCQYRYLQKHYCTHPSNMTPPSTETLLDLKEATDSVHYEIYRGKHVAITALGDPDA